MSKIEVNQISSQCGSTLTIGQSGDTVTLASGATQTGFGRTGTVDWCTTAKTAPFTGVSGKGYFVNTTCAAVTVTLPATPSAGDIISIKDYARTAATNNINFCRNGSKMDSVCANGLINTNGDSTTLIYVDGTQGWTSILDNTTNQYGALFLTASGGTVTTCGDYKVHTFTSSGTFTVCSVGNPLGSDSVDYLVVAGGGSSGDYYGGGGGAGGFREGYNPGSYTASPLATTALPVSVTTYPITVGGGGAAVFRPGINIGNPGSPSVFSTITSTGGGGGNGTCIPGTPAPGQPGGSGGGGGGETGGTGGTGNTPPVSPPQGNTGGTSTGEFGAAGGGATAVGASGPSGPTNIGGAGAGTGINSSCTVGTPGPSPSLRYFAGGGGGGGGGAGGVGGGGDGVGAGGPAAGSGVANTGGGGGSEQSSGGSGIVIIRYKFQQELNYEYS